MRLALALLLALVPTAVLAEETERLPPAPPYLQDGRPGQVTIVWRSATPAAAAVVVRDEAGRKVFEHEVPPVGQPLVVVTGLRPGGLYTYTVQEEGRAEPWRGRFINNHGPDEDHVRFAVIGDMGDGSPSQLAIARQLAAWGPEAVLTVGDNVYPDATPAQFGRNFFAPYGALMANVVFYPTLGNHDIRTANGAPYLAAFVLPQEPAGGRYYAFDDGPARFYCLDSNQALDPSSPQYQWLAGDAAASPARWKLAFLHHPPYSSGLHGQEARNREWLPPLFSRLHFAAVFTGHDHHYERSKPQGGVVYFVTGGGGAKLYGTTEQPFSAYKAVRHEFLAATISGSRLGVEAIDEQGKALDGTAIPMPNAI